jgi:Flp pilus assembly protein TadG
VVEEATVMISRKSIVRGRRGTTALEFALVSPVAILLLLGTIVVSVGVFQHEQLQFLARAGARYASVHGPLYASENSLSKASTSTVLTKVQGLAVGLNGLNCTAVTYSATNLPCTVSVTLTYTWTPPRLFNPMTWTVTSTMPVTY